MLTSNATHIPWRRLSAVTSAKALDRMCYGDIKTLTDQEVLTMIKPGKNIAIKVPLHKWEETVAFYRDRVGLDLVKELTNSMAFAFGDMTLWIDRVERQSQVDVWLEFFSDDPDTALQKLESPLRDELEPLDDVKGHWTSDPAGVILLVRQE